MALTARQLDNEEHTRAQFLEQCEEAGYEGHEPGPAITAAAERWSDWSVWMPCQPDYQAADRAWRAGAARAAAEVRV